MSLQVNLDTIVVPKWKPKIAQIALGPNTATNVLQTGALIKPDPGSLLQTQ